MTDRHSFLVSLAARPDDDTAHLAFADWLDEHGAGDPDAATAEFLRVSCRPRAELAPPMPRAAYPWLRDNWRRLVPRVVRELNANHQHDASCGGRYAHLSLGVAGADLPLVVQLEFVRGFLRVCSFDGPPEAGELARALWRALAADQPLARVGRRGRMSVMSTVTGRPVFRRLTPLRPDRGSG